MDQLTSDKLRANISLERLIEAQLLLLIGLQPSHGYELIQRLNDAEFTGEEVDPATIYRHLRRMDKLGFVQSHWETGSSGPGRRLYKLTDLGQEVLTLWSVHIQQQKDKLQKFLYTYTQFINLNMSSRGE